MDSCAQQTLNLNSYSSVYPGGSRGGAIPIPGGVIISPTRTWFRGPWTALTLNNYRGIIMSIKHLTLALCMAMLATSIQAETLNCTPITSLPATITAQGLYCLTAKLGTNQTSGNAITINANNVTIDLNGWKVDDGSAGTGTQAFGIYSTANNVTIKNGIVRGFSFGIELDGSGAVIQDMLLDGNTVAGIVTFGTGALVEHNQIVNTGGSTVFSNSNAVGMDLAGSDSTASDNTVSALTATGTGGDYGIAIDGSNNVARNNTVFNNNRPSGGGTAYGISSTGSSDIITNNTINNFVYCVYNIASSDI